MISDAALADTSGAFIVSPDGRFVFPDGSVTRCTLGRGGVVAADDKREGDGATPEGAWRMAYMFFRPDRVATPLRTGLPVIPLRPHDGWCDDPDSVLYNRPVSHPFRGSAERLWREDHVYDLIVPLAYNTHPVVKGRGSAIFIHLMAEDGGPTEGCIGLALPDMMKLLAGVKLGSEIAITR